MKKILFINGHLKVGGCEKSLLDVLNHFDYSKYEVDLLLLEEGVDYLDYVNQKVRVFRYPLEKAFGRFPNVIKESIKNKDWFSFRFRLIHIYAIRNHFRFYRQSRSLFAGLRNEYDVIVSYRPGICAVLAAFAFKSDKRITWWHHGEYAEYSAAEPSFGKMDYLVCVSKSSADIVRDHYPQFSKKIRVIPNMIDVKEAVSLSNEMGKSKNESFNIVTVGRMSPEKNMSFCIEIAKNLLNKGVNFKWSIIGDGEEYGRISQLIIDEKLDDYINLTGRLENPYPIIRNSNVLVHPSLVESQGITVLEAMALSVPVIVVDSAGPREYIKNMENGIIMKPDAECFADAIYRIYSGIIDTEIMVDNALKTVKCFSPGTIIKQIEELL